MKLQLSLCVIAGLAFGIGTGVEARYRAQGHARRALDLTGHAAHFQQRRDILAESGDQNQRMRKQLRRQPLASPGLGAVPVMNDGTAQVVGLVARGEDSSLGSHNGEEGAAYRGTLASTSSDSSSSSNDSTDSSDSSDDSGDDEDCEEEDGDDTEDDDEDCEDDEEDDGSDDDEDCEDDDETDDSSSSSTDVDTSSGTTSSSAATGSSSPSTSDSSSDSCEADEDDTSSSSTSTSTSSDSSSTSGTDVKQNIKVNVGVSAGNGDDSSSSSSQSSSNASSTSKSSSSGTKTSSAAQYQGTATWFTQNGNAGNCGKVNPDSAKVIALYTSLYGNGQYCGKQVKIENLDDGTSVIATVADSCPSCGNENNIDLSVGAFQAMDPNYKQDGVRNIKWSFID